MKYILLALLTCCAQLAVADGQNPCDVPIPPGQVYNYVDVAPGAPVVPGSTMPVTYPCAPGPVGKGTLPTLRTNSAGVMVWWYCQTFEGAWLPQWSVATTAFLSGSTIMADAYSVVTSKDPLAAVNAVAAKNITLPLNDPSLTPVWCPFQQEMIEATPVASPLPVVSYRTPATGTFTLYTAANGKLTGVISGRKATAGATCDCTTPVMSGGAMYCPLAGAPTNEVTYCVKVVQ